MNVCKRLMNTGNKKPKRQKKKKAHKLMNQIFLLWYICLLFSLLFLFLFSALLFFSSYAHLHKKTQDAGSGGGAGNNGTMVSNTGTTLISKDHDNATMK